MIEHLPLLLLGSALAVISAPTASARDAVPVTFYNQPGATLEMKRAELQRCRLIATAPMSAPEQKALTRPTNPERFPRDSEVGAQSVESCMVMRGWRVYALSSRERDILARMSAQARAQAMRILTGASRPRQGRLVRDGTGVLLRNPARL